MRPFELVLTSHLGFPRSVEVPFGGLTIGREDGCDVCVNSRRLSRRHARFVRLDDHVYVEDLGSTNGTRVDGRHVQGRVRVEAGMFVVMGDVVAMLADDAPFDPEHRGSVTVICESGSQPPRELSFTLPLSVRFVAHDSRANLELRIWRGPGGHLFVVREQGPAPMVWNDSRFFDEATRLSPDDVLHLEQTTIRARPSISGDRVARSFEVPGGLLALIPGDPDLLER